MAGELFTSDALDTDGRQLVLDDNILSVYYYDASAESWDRDGASLQSWFTEKFKPHDFFDTATVSSEKWIINDTATATVSTTSQTNGVLLLGVEEDEGIVSLSSDSKWRLSGDFDVRLYIDWESYYNEYRGITDTFLKVGYDDENSARLSFSFDGVGGFEFRAEKLVDRNFNFFEWLISGAANALTDFSEAEQYTYFKLVRQSGVITAYLSTGATQIQVGDSISDAVFSNDLFVEFGVSSLEFNTYRSGFLKFFVASGTITPTLEFFSTVRGEKQAFPNRVIMAVDQSSLSLIDESDSTLWMRFLFGTNAPLPDSNLRVRACNGVVYCATSDGLVALDFVQDRIYKYKGSDLLLADEPLALRNADPVFQINIDNYGTFSDDNVHDVACRTVEGQDYVALVNDSGVSVIRPLASGVANSADGPQPGVRVEISEKGAVFWSGYDSPNNTGELSFFSNISTLTSSGTTFFSRTGHYGVDTPLAVFGSNIATFDILTKDGVDLAAVGTSEGLTFIALSPGAPFTDSVSYGVVAPATNPFSDPSFDNYLGLSWKIAITGFHEIFDVRRVTPGLSGETYAVRLGYSDPITNQQLQVGDSMSVYQDVDLTGVANVYFDLDITAPSGFGADTSVWNFKVKVGDTVLKTYQDLAGAFTKANDSVDTSIFSGVQRVSFVVETVIEHSLPNIDQRAVTIGGIKTKIGDPDFRVLPAGNASIQEVLLQYDEQGHKIYFSSVGGYGAVDLDDNSLDYFIQLDSFGPDNAENVSGDFSRIIDEA